MNDVEMRSRWGCALRWKWCSGKISGECPKWLGASLSPAYRSTRRSWSDVARRHQRCAPSIRGALLQLGTNVHAPSFGLSTHISAPLHPTPPSFRTFVRPVRPALSLGFERRGFHIILGTALLSFRVSRLVAKSRADSIQIYRVCHHRTHRWPGYRCQSADQTPKGSHPLHRSPRYLDDVG